MERSTETAIAIFEETRENSLNSNSFAKANSFQNDSNTFEAKPSEHALPAHLCTMLHVVLLEKLEAHAGDGVCTRWQATCQSKSMAMDPHGVTASEPMILFEVPREDCKFQADLFHLKA